MGTLFFTDAMHPGDGRGEEGILRQVEIFRPSGEEYLTLRIGEPDEQKPIGATQRLARPG